MKKIDIDHPEILHTSLENFKREDLPIRSILSDGRIIYASEDTQKFNMFDFYQNFFRHTSFSNNKKPFILLHACFSMPWLEQIVYSEEIQQHLNHHGLDIYLLETLFLYKGLDKKIYRDLLVTPDDGIPWEELQFVFNENEEHLRSFELDSIEKFIVKNNLKNVIVYTEEYQSEEFFLHTYKTFKISSKPLFHFVWKGISEGIGPIANLSEKIDKKFICLNRRYDYHRHIISSFLYDKNCILGWDHKIKFDELKNNLWFDITKWNETLLTSVETNANALYQNPPGMLEKGLSSTGSCPTGLPLPSYDFGKAFCYVITESYYAYPFGLIDEKVVNSIALFKPFVLVGPPRSLEYFRSFGFKTFDQWWDESYDHVNNHEHRMLKIMDLISHIDSISITQLKKIYTDMSDLLSHNFNLLNRIHNK